MIGGTLKQPTKFAEMISEEETECVGGVWFALLIGTRQGDGKEVIELRTWKHGMLQDVVTEWFDRRVKEHRFERDFEALKTAKEKEKLDHWCEDIRHA